MADTRIIAEDEPGLELRQMDLQSWALSQFAVQASSNEILLVGNEMTPGYTSEGALTPFAKVTPVVLLRLSPQTMKDLTIILSETLKKYEDSYGEIHTSYSKTRQE